MNTKEENWQQGRKPDICKKYRDDGFRVDLGHFGHFRGTKIVGGRFQVDRPLLELEDWITAGQVSAGTGTEARGDWIRGKWMEVVEFQFNFMDFYLDL